MASHTSTDSRLPQPHSQYAPLAENSKDEKSTANSDELGRNFQISSYPRLLCSLVALLLLVVIFVMRGYLSGNAATVEVSLPDQTQLLQVKPQADLRIYQHLTLPNGLQVVNIQDNQSRQMAMSMAVRAGSYDNPKELPGLAHFCEHMLFLGTEKYPEPSGFDQFLQQYGGASNAYTASEATVYFASASHRASEEGLDRFADFFRAPLFKKEFVQKEVNAINSEHAKNVQDNFYRIYELMNSKADPRSPVGRFATGDIKTLYDEPKRNGSSPVDALQTYFKERYCIPQMRLVTFGPQSLEEQVHLVKKAGFDTLSSGAEACGASARSFADPPPFPPDRMGRMMTVKGTEAIGQLWLHFELPSLTRHYAGQPLSYLNYVLQYGGTNSLGRILSDGLGLISSQEVQADTSSAGTALFVIFHLTDLGQSHPEAVLDIFYNYLASIRKSGVDMDFYKSLQEMYQLEWDWSEPLAADEVASSLAEAMTRLPTKELLSGDSLISRKDPDFLSSIWKSLKPDNMNVALVSPSSLGDQPLKKIAGNTKLRTLPHYDVKYVERKVEEAMPGATDRWNSWLKGGFNADDLGKRLQEHLKASKLFDAANAIAAQTAKDPKMPTTNVEDGLVLPPRIPSAIQGIPRNISLEHMHSSARGHSEQSLGTSNLRAAAFEGWSADSKADALYGPAPVQLSLSIEGVANISLLAAENKDVWFRSGWVNPSPKVKLAVEFRALTNATGPEEDALHSIRLSIYRQLLMEAIAPELYDLTAAGSTYELNMGPSDLGITFAGYQEALPHLISKVMTAFNSFNEQLNATRPDRFMRVVNSMREEMKTYSEMPAKYAGQDREILLRRGVYSQNERLAILEAEADGEGFIAAERAAGDLLLSQNLHMTALAIGNFGQAQAAESLRSIASQVQRPSWAHQVPSTGSVQRVPRVVKPSRPIELRVANPRPGDPNDVASLTILYGVSDVRSRVALGIIASILGTAAFDELRTQRQLGYVVSGGISMTSNVLMVSTVVQGTKLHADDAEAAIEGLFTSIMPKILKDMSEADFRQQVDAYRQQLLSPPLGVSEEITHFWEHIIQGGCMYLLDEALSFLTSSECSKGLLIDTWKRVLSGSSDDKEKWRNKISVKYFAVNNSGIPSRPSLEEAKASWSKQGVASDAMELLSTEWENTKVLDRANSEVRAELAKDGGYFPGDLLCTNSQTGEKQEEIVMRQQPAVRYLSLLHAQGPGKSLRRP
mmetsp:Transcript_59031/g.104910  ORF Transcript_59031/g.104910 Transcript_59031/m.104910 type:complete len:1231 (+) Transcript_59031:42-3734(+)